MRWLALVAALMVGGCYTNMEPTQAELRDRWEAQNVFPAGYKQDLLAFLRTYLNDPTRIRDAAVAPPTRKTIAPAPAERFVVCVRYRARKSDGNYGPSKDGAATFVSGKLDRYFDEPQKQVRELCKDVAFAPFPELEKLTR